MYKMQINLKFSKDSIYGIMILNNFILLWIIGSHSFVNNSRTLLHII